MQKFTTTMVLLMCVALHAQGQERRSGGFFGGGRGALPSASIPAEKPPSSDISPDSFTSPLSSADRLREEQRRDCAASFPRNETIKLLVPGSRFTNTTEWRINNTTSNNLVIRARVGTLDVADLYIAAKSEAKFIVPAEPMALGIRAGDVWCGPEKGFLNGLNPTTAILPFLFGKSSEGETTKVVQHGVSLFAYTKERHLVIKD
jgi:hypothetical protein